MNTGTVKIVYAHSVYEYLDFIRGHRGELDPADSVSRRWRGVKTKDGLVTMVLPITVMFEQRETIGEKTRRLLLTTTGQLIHTL